MFRDDVFEPTALKTDSTHGPGMCNELEVFAGHGDTKSLKRPHRLLTLMPPKVKVMTKQEKLEFETQRRELCGAQRSVTLKLEQRIRF